MSLSKSLTSFWLATQEGLKITADAFGIKTNIDGWEEKLKKMRSTFGDISFPHDTQTGEVMAFFKKQVVIATEDSETNNMKEPIGRGENVPEAVAHLWAQMTKMKGREMALQFVEVIGENEGAVYHGFEWNKSVNDFMPLFEVTGDMPPDRPRQIQTLGDPGTYNNVGAPLPK